MTISEMLLLITIMYGVLMYFLSLGIIALVKQSLIAFGFKTKNHILIFDDVSFCCNELKKKQQSNVGVKE